MYSLTDGRRCYAKEYSKKHPAVKEKQCGNPIVTSKETYIRRSLCKKAVV
jgi:hypothetical protein